MTGWRRSGRAAARLMLVVTVAALQLGAARAAEPPAAAGVDLAPAARRRHVLGLQLDAGVPDGASATVLYRPLKYLRVGGGLLYNYVGYGVRGSVSVLPYFPIAPSLTLEAGHYFDANAGAKVARFTQVSADVAPMLERVGYTFVNAQLGLEIGHPDWFVFFVRGGLGRTWLDVHDAQAAAQRSSSGGTQVTAMADPTVRLGNPSVKLGFMIFFY